MVKSLIMALLHLKSSIMLLVFLVLCSTLVYGQKGKAEGLKEGDIIFQKLPCGGLCDAIIATTPCKPGMAFNHCGIIHYNDGAPFVIEAIGKAVKTTSVVDFLKRDKDKQIFLGRIKSVKAGIDSLAMKRAVNKALRYVGVPYDDVFLPGDTALYCSELVWECYRNSTSENVFELKPMTFKSPESGTTFPAWVSYYQELSRPIPEGVPGINPCAIANSDIVEFIVLEKNEYLNK